jgi:hypothetical protein
MAVIFPILSTFDAAGVNSAQRAFKGLNGVAKTAAIAFGAITIAAVKFGVDASKAAAADEKSMRILQKQLENTLGANKAMTASVEDYISKTQMRVGVQDDKLRPSFARLVRSTEDAVKAQELLNLALDIQVATGKPLEDIVNALGKGYDGNAAAIGRLGLGIDTSILKSKDFNTVTETLKKTFGGFADDEATTLEGKLRIFNIAIDEAKESVGKALLPALTKLMDYIIKNVLPVLQVFINALTGNQGLSSSFTQSEQAAYTWGNVIRAVIQTVVNYIPFLVKFGAALVGMFVVAKVAAAAGAIIKIVGGLVTAFQTLRKVGLAATIATAFATGGLSVAAGAAGTVAALAAIAVGFAALDKVTDKYKENVAGLPPIFLAPDGVKQQAKDFQDVVLPTIDKVGSSAKTASKGVAGIGDAAKLSKDKIAAFTEELNKQNGVLESARSAFASFKSTVRDTLTGIIDFSAAATAESGSFIDNLVAQAAKAADFGAKVKTLLSMGLSESAIGQVLAAGADAGIKIADEIIAGGATVVDQVNTLISATASVAEELGTSAATQFYQAGITAGQSLVDGVRAAIAAAGFVINTEGQIINQAGIDAVNAAVAQARTGKTKKQRGISKKERADITALANSLGVEVPAMAAGGIVTGPTLALIGEAGPEAVVPLTGRNAGMGTTINLTVNAGMGADGNQIGREIVDIIKRYERVSGPVFASA